MFSLPSTAHFGQQSPGIDPAIIGSGIAAAPAPSVPPAQTAGNPNDISGNSPGVATGEPQLINYNYLLLQSTSNSPTTRSAPGTGGSYAPTRGRSRATSSPCGGQSAAARVRTPRSVPNSSLMVPDSAREVSQGVPVPRQACLPRSGSINPSSNVVAAASCAGAGAGSDPRQACLPREGPGSGSLGSNPLDSNAGLAFPLSPNVFALKDNASPGPKVEDKKEDTA